MEASVLNGWEHQEKLGEEQYKGKWQKWVKLGIN